MTVPSGTAGDGLVRPLNAPSGNQVLPGVQPGVSSGVTLAQYVIIYGSSSGGSGPGLFIYATGTSPGPGNPPIYSDSNATEDPYGNSINPGIWAGQFDGTQAGLEVNGTIGQLAFPVAGSNAVATAAIVGRPGGLSGGSVLQVISAQDTGAGADRVVLQLADNTAELGESATWFLVYQDAGSPPVGWIQATGGCGGVAFNSVSELTGVLPGTGTSSTNAAQPETWHDIIPDAGWTIVNQPQYRLLPGIGVQVTGLLTHAATAAQTSINSANPIPSAYWPPVTRYYRTPQAADLAGAVQIQATGGTPAGGTFVMRASGFNATQAIMDGIYAL